VGKILKGVIMEDQEKEKKALHQRGPELGEILQWNREALTGKYRSQVMDLLGLTELEIWTITGCPVDHGLLEALIAVVMEASRRDLKEEILSARIRRLGREAIAIARLVPSLGNLLGDG